MSNPTTWRAQVALGSDEHSRERLLDALGFLQMRPGTPTHTLAVESRETTAAELAGAPYTFMVLRAERDTLVLEQRIANGTPPQKVLDAAQQAILARLATHGITCHTS